MRVTLRTALVAGCAALAISGQAVAVAATGTTRTAGTTTVAVGRPAISGREVFTIVSLAPGAKRPKITAKGAFAAKGYLIRRLGTAVFPAGRIKISHHAAMTSYYGPSLRTCRFKIRQKGTFRVVWATRRYAGLREHGDYRTTISGRLGRTGADQCSSKIVSYRSVTYEVGIVR